METTPSHTYLLANDKNGVPMPTLFDSLKLGALTLPNRIVMAPLTRLRAGAERVPNELMAEYYTQRASAGLIISEATSVTPRGVGYYGSPGIWNAEQVAGWRIVTDAVHAAGGRIFIQLWHVGRISDPEFHNGAPPVAPSAIAAEGHVALLRPKRDYVVPHALTTEEVHGVLAAFRHGAELANQAGFDGAEIHGANGYLLDQFLQTRTNHRDDEYGGSLENRARLLLEVTDAVISVFGADRVGVHLAPRCDVHSEGDANPEETFTYVASQLGQRKIAFICAREKVADDSLAPKVKAAFGGVFIANEGFDGASAQAALTAGWADAVAFGQAFIANPDLPERLRTGAALNPPDFATFYAPSAAGYTDYPVLQAAE
jgi:2,4-dienoyl-CoA reductase-like NADH-dependent reductase (Old Yellow Enzyme family)